MAHEHTLDSVEENKEINVSPLRLASSSSLADIFNPSGYEYEHLNLDESEDIARSKGQSGQLSHQSSANSLGIFPDQRERAASVHSALVSEKSPEITSASEIASPGSTSHLLESPPCLNFASSKSPHRRGRGLHGIVERAWPWNRHHKSGYTSTTSNEQPQATDIDPSSTLDPDPDTEAGDDTIDDETFHKIYSQPPISCSSHENPSRDRNILMTMVSVYSTCMSGIWLVVAFKQIRWNNRITSKSMLEPSTASILSTVIAKSIELSFIASFAWCVGQQLTRRAYQKSRGLTLAEISMRGWINKPGAWFGNWQTLRYGGRTILTPLTVMMILATIGATLYTPASDALVSPKLKFDSWHSQELQGPVLASYGNLKYTKSKCPAMFGGSAGALQDDACVNVEFSGQSYRNLLAFMETWTKRIDNGTDLSTLFAKRPVGTSLLNNNVTMVGAWINTQYSNVTESSEKYGRIVNNVTMAMPHPGVYAAATHRNNRIVQPDELSGVGQYSIRAGVVSPTINTMCVAVTKDELAPLVYTTWPNSKVNKSGVGDQLVPIQETLWKGDVPHMFDSKGKPNYYNRTVLDDIFKWGPKYQRWPPVFTAYPYDFNFISNSTVTDSTGIYTIAKPAEFENYTLCEARSWLSAACSTRFDVSGTSGSRLSAHCEDADDINAYHRSYDKPPEWETPSKDWRLMGEQWQLSMDMNGGQRNSNSSNSRILTRTALKENRLLQDLPSLAEVWAVYLASSIVIGSIDSPYKHYWEYATPDNILKEPTFHRFNASIMSQEYTSGHIHAWHRAWYSILIIVFALNLASLSYILLHRHTITDFTETENLFTLAINSPPSSQFKGSCGGGPKKRDFVVPWKGRYSKTGKKRDGVVVEQKGDSYKRLSQSKAWL
ncbi:hypothetical protein ED733_001305 [Metarhizium rileyi]|uniref:Mcm2 3 5 family protein n=1 Tax=Metarhizium rileyi (strain RCEF 4871) TaxID=1649241 RepID=A0A5C6G829_METRR|nr:hypothetical protein ED733_001305 [Metarhizium rileyi]